MGFYFRLLIMKQFDSINFLLKFALVLYSLMLLGTLTSCTEDPISDIPDNYTMELDGRLDTTNEGLYKLELNSTQNSIQTIHRITGKLLNNGEEPLYPQLVNWESSHQWILNDTAYVFIRRTINIFTILRCAFLSWFATTDFHSSITPSGTVLNLTFFEKYQHFGKFI